MSFVNFMPAKIVFGNGSLDELSKYDLPGKKALIVTGGTSTKKFGYLNRLTAQLKTKGIAFEVFDHVLPNPISDHVMEAARLCKNEKCDFVVGIGGGSSIDSAKAIAVMATNEGHLWDYISMGSGLGKKPANNPLPIVAIPTTAGTGTEADPWAVITHNEEKIGFGFDTTFPYLSVVDPMLTLSVPPHLTAYQGFDALFHATEGYINKFATPISDMFALKSIALLGQSLPKCVENGNDFLARENVSMASMLSGYVETLSGCTSCHSLEHALSALAPNLEHGAGLIMLSLEYYRYFVDAEICGERFIDMAKALGYAEASKPADFLTALENLQKDCDVANLKMSDYGIKRDALKKAAENAYKTMGSLFDCDREELDLKNSVKIYEKSYK